MGKVRMNVVRMNASLRIGAQHRGMGGPVVIHNKQHLVVRMADMDYLAERTKRHPLQPGIAANNRLYRAYFDLILAARGGDVKAIGILRALEEKPFVVG